MKEKISKYSYLPRRIIRAGIFCSIIICILFFLHGSIAVYYIPSSYLLDKDVLFSRIIGGTISYFLAVGLVFYTKDYLQKLIPAWLLVFSLGSVILILFTFPYLYIGRFIESKNCEVSGFNWSTCSVLSFEQFILSSTLAFILSFIITGLLFSIVHYLYKSLSKKAYLK